VISDSQGNRYGTANLGGASGVGVVYKLDTTGHLTVLYSFTCGSDGTNPSGVIRDSAGNLYGTTGSGGTGAGVVFKLDTSGRETVLHNFTGGADGSAPLGGLVRDPAGNFYGVTQSGGKWSSGIVFKPKP
jgi:uncharacterized repeat protein (TIGR03803 family)